MVIMALVIFYTSNLLGVVNSASAATVTVPKVEYKTIQVGDEQVYQVAPEDIPKFKEYLQSGDSDLISPQASTGFWARVAWVVFGAIIDAVVATALDSALNYLRTHNGKAGDVEQASKVLKVKVLYADFDANDYKTWACDTCVNSSYYVELLQRALNSIGISPGSIDGYWGPNTKGAVKNFQKLAGLTQDGSCGPGTWKKLSHK